MTSPMATTNTGTHTGDESIGDQIIDDFGHTGDFVGTQDNQATN